MFSSEAKKYDDNRSQAQDSASRVERSLEEVSHSMDEIKDRVRDASAKATEESKEFVKKYPLHTTIGAALVGFALGAIATRGSRS